MRPLDKGGPDHVITHRYSCSQTVVAPVDDASSKRSENIIIGDGLVLLRNFLLGNALWEMGLSSFSLRHSPSLGNVKCASIDSILTHTC